MRGKVKKRRGYPGFTPLNHRRGELIFKKHQGGGLVGDEEVELEMLQGVVELMVEFMYPSWPNLDYLKEIEAKMKGIVKKAGLCMEFAGRKVKAKTKEKSNE